MLVKLFKATTITLTMYALLGLNTLQPATTAQETVEPAEVIVALKAAIARNTTR